MFTSHLIGFSFAGNNLVSSAKIKFSGVHFLI